jgi:hypothetical protein
MTKYGGKNIIEVDSCGFITCIDMDHGITYHSEHIITTNGVTINLDGSDGRLYKITKFHNKKETEIINKLIGNLC